MAFLRNKDHNTPANKSTNREHMVNHLRVTDMKVANAYYQTLDKFKGTCQRNDNIDGGPSWNTDRYCELDLCLVRRQWINFMIDIRTDPYTNIHTDPRSIENEIRQELKAREQPNSEQSLKGT